jgi:hypothetical protein
MMSLVRLKWWIFAGIKQASAGLGDGVSSMAQETLCVLQDYSDADDHSGCLASSCGL